MKPYGVKDIAVELFALTFRNEFGIEEVFGDTSEPLPDWNSGQYEYWHRDQEPRLCGDIVKKRNCGAACGQALNDREHQQRQPRDRGQDDRGSS